MMHDYTITIPEALYKQAQVIAKHQHESVDTVIQRLLGESLAQPRLLLPHDEQAELAALAYLADDTLWTIAREQLPVAKQTQLQTLMLQNNLGAISELDYQRLEQLVDDGQRLTLRKAEAMHLLIQRGFTIQLEDLAP